MKKAKIASTRSFSFINKTLKLPNGHTGTYLCVEHIGACAIIPLISKDKVVLINQFRIALEKYIWEIPAGTLEKNEKPEICAKRELIEEIGYKAGKIKKLGEIYPAVGYSDEVLHIFKATNLKKTKTRREKDEIIEPKVFTKVQIRQMVRNGKIKDSKTISAFAMLGWV
jgi:ADP-ribose pyrophosphatase